MCIGDLSQTGGQNLPSTENAIPFSQRPVVSDPVEKPNKEETKSSSQGYADMFKSFFGGGSQNRTDPSPTNTSDQIAQSFGQATISSSFGADSQSSVLPQMPVPHIQNVQTYAPVSQPSMNESFHGGPPIGFVHTPTYHQSQGNSWSAPQFYTSNDNCSEPFQNVVPSQTPSLMPRVQSGQSALREVQTSSSLETNSGSNSESQLNTSSIGFEQYGTGLNSKSQALGGIVKSQSSLEFPTSAFSDNKTGNASSYFNSTQPQSATTTGPYFYQTRAASVDSFASVQAPPPPLQGGMPSPQVGMPPPPIATPSLTSAPPMSGPGKNYRRDVHKRLAYAPVPGLSSNTVVSSSYLVPSDNFPTYPNHTYTALTPESKPPLSTSLSQPAMDLSRAPADSSASLNASSSVNSSISANSLQNFFVPQYTSSSSSNSQTASNSLDTITSSSNLSSSSAEYNSQNPIAMSSISPSVSFQQQMSNLSLSSSGSGYPVTSVAVHPTIMSTKEQASPPVSNLPERSPSPPVIPASFNNLANLGHSGIIYRPAYHHWFLRIETKYGKEIWQPFSMTDSLALEQAINSDELTSDTVVQTDGGRYDVNVSRRIRTAAYWEEKPKTVMRCSWFYKSTTESRLHPYDENTAFNLEEEYKKSVQTNNWNRKVDLPSGDHVIMYGPNSIALFPSRLQTPEGWEAETDFTENRPKIVKRGILDDFEIDEGEPPAIDHLVFVVHGIGSVCDFKFRTVEEADGDLDDSTDSLTNLSKLRLKKVDGFRSKSHQLIKSHFRNASEQGLVNRIEILPVSWHGHLHGATTGVDQKLQTITLKSIPRLRNFTNDTLLDILFYTSPMYCETIMQQVGHEINTLYAKFKSRNPNFNGGVSLAGHSLGSLILFDMLCHQKPITPRADVLKRSTDTNIISQEVHTTASSEKKKPVLSHKVSYVIGTAGTGQPYIEYPQLSFQPLAFFAMGSPIGMFVTVRGIDSLGLDFSLPTCSRFFNIFHPFDPVAYRVEALINPELSEKRPVLIPHHKGRKRMHLELKETMGRVGADLKQRLIDSVRSTWNTVYQLTMFGRADDGLEQEVNKVIEKQLERQQTESAAAQCLNDCYDTDFDAGKLNQGRRIDYVLQEAPLESFNEYVSALTSHVIYWDSEDTMLLILKEIYDSKGISPDSQGAIPGQGGPGQDESTLPIASTSNTGDIPSPPPFES
ncbi:hypothetical protein RUM44_001083 [Polyplax serrata]|uniref:DDHD domain-containing protein n=1 Tax=Polyplax serrata TaxID=468196 RepID=A0ABR1B9G4_POLSC